MLEEQQEDEARDPWKLMRSLAAGVVRKPLLRAAQSLPEQMFAIVLRAHDALDLGVPPSMEPHSFMSTLQDMPDTEMDRGPHDVVQ